MGDPCGWARQRGHRSKGTAQQTRRIGLTARPPTNKGRRFPAELLSPDEVRALLRACSSRAPTGIRNRALIAVLYRGGLRVSEALALHVKDIDLSLIHI